MATISKDNIKNLIRQILVENSQRCDYEDKIADGKSGRRQVRAQAIDADGDRSSYSKAHTYTPGSERSKEEAYKAACSEAKKQSNEQDDEYLRSAGRAAAENKRKTTNYSENILNKEKKLMKIGTNKLKGIIDEEVSRALVEFSNPQAEAGSGPVSSGGPAGTEVVIKASDGRGPQVTITVSTVPASEGVDRPAYKAEVPRSYPDTGCRGTWGHSIRSSVDAVRDAIKGCTSLSNVTDEDIKAALRAAGIESTFQFGSGG
ncbi:MAG TPA: hypothetical protein DEB18_16490 [Leeuwenhoekiella sp.]|nr:hypothetical protein [Leeuwenhoekiella sp.]